MSSKPPSSTTRARWLAVVGMALAVPVGFGVKFYSGPGAQWANHSLAGAIYEIFWQFAVLFCLPRARPWKIALGVFIATCGIEFLQLWNPPLLETLRGNFAGRAVLGSTFAWSDFPYYILGSLAGWGILTRLARLTANGDPTPTPQNQSDPQ
ncbi:MAG: ribosomal maturation YjgA family protein [Verrucomicrobiia bacterium]|jgi:hypothetical protein